jgi:hypothetical protein
MLLARRCGWWLRAGGFGQDENHWQSRNRRRDKPSIGLRKSGGFEHYPDFEEDLQ